MAADTALERQVLYYPNDTKYGNKPAGVEEREIITADGLTLSAWYLPPPVEGDLILYFHGNGGNLTSLGSVVEVFRELGLGVLAVDYRGFGKSEGEPSEQGLYLDGLAAFDFARDLGAPIILFGRSLGGGVATYVASEREAKALILESTFTSAKEVARYSHGEKGALAITAFDNLEWLKEVDEPLFLIHGEEDETVPAFMSEEIHKAAAGSELWMVRGANHNNVRPTAGQEYKNRIEEFLKNLAPADS